MPRLSDIASEDYQAKLAREMSYSPQQEMNNPIGDALVSWGKGVRERVTHPLETLANEATRWRTMPIEQKTNEVAGMLNPLGMVRMAYGKTDNIAKLMKEAEEARFLYELQHAQRMQQMNQPSNALRNIMVGTGALGGGSAAGYYGMGMVE